MLEKGRPRRAVLVRDSSSASQTQRGTGMQGRTPHPFPRSLRWPRAAVSCFKRCPHQSLGLHHRIPSIATTSLPAPKAPCRSQGSGEAKLHQLCLICTGGKRRRPRRRAEVKAEPPQCPPAGGNRRDTGPRLQQPQDYREKIKINSRVRQRKEGKNKTKKKPKPLR